MLSEHLPRALLRSVAAPALGLGLLATGGAAHAAIAYNGGFGTTVYGVAPYGGGPQVFDSYIANNLSGFNDILASPGGGFLTANPVIANNIFETPINVGLPLYSFQSGGGNGFGPFGDAETFIAGPNIAFRIEDVFAGGGSASYSVSTWTANFEVDAGGFDPDGTLGNYLSIGGQVSSPDSAVAVSLISHFYLNGVYEGSTDALVLAAANNGNFQALGGAGAFLDFLGGGLFVGFASNAFTDNFAFGRDLIVGDDLSIVTTLTAYADPASINTFDIPLDLKGIDLPDFAFSSGSGSLVPEPSAWAVMILGFAGVGAAMRRRRVAVA